MIRLRLKRAVERMPEPLGRLTSAVPLSARLGRTYRQTRIDAQAFERLGVADQMDVLLPRVKSIVGFAYREIPFYRSVYRQAGFHPNDLEEWQDFTSVPIVSKSMMQDWGIEQRSRPLAGRLQLNTGGTSGQPLAFFVDRKAFAREWAHMYGCWCRLGYRTWRLKLTFRGRELGNDLIRYNALHNEVLVNAYAPVEDVVDAVRRYALTHRIEFLHGYPSAIYEFVRVAQGIDPRALEPLRRSLRGILYGSEYPAPVYREFVEKALRTPSISWYGHSEMAVFAQEIDSYRYAPSHTYGVAEALPIGDGRSALVGTSLHNTASPFIRYDTGDLVEPLVSDGLLRSFKIAEGRIGEFVTDRDGGRISLTALVFGRHHELLDFAYFVQIRQRMPGAITVIATVPSGTSVEDVVGSFDSHGLNLDLDFELVDRPVVSERGKVSLLVG